MDPIKKIQSRYEVIDNNSSDRVPVELKPPFCLKNYPERKVFLAGSIEMGKAIDWQKETANKLIESCENLVIINPRRDDWDSSWEQKIENEKFNEQVSWELDHLDVSDYIILYLQPRTYSPISLLELGLHAARGNLLVVCPEGFWKKGNVDIECKRHNIACFDTLDEAINSLIKRLEE